MGKFVIECPSCGRYAEGKTGFFAKKTIDCVCGYTINVKTDKMASRECKHCGNMVVYDQTLGDEATCPVCHEKIGKVPGNNTKTAPEKKEEFTCKQCGVHLSATPSTEIYVCPICDFENDVKERLAMERIRKQDLASVVKYDGDSETLAWKHPLTDFSYGSQLIVAESQEAVFFRNGVATDTLTAGRYTLETSHLPELSKVSPELAEKNPTFHSEVYFVNKMNQMGIKWGTPDKVRFIDPLSEAPMVIGARGLLNFRIGDSKKFLLKLVGTTGGMNRQDLLGEGNGDTKNYFRSVITTNVSTYLADVIQTDNIDILQIDRERMRLSEALKARIAPAFEEYGLIVTEFLVEGVVLPQPGDLGYDALSTIEKLHQQKLQMSVLKANTDMKMAEDDAQKQILINQTLNQAVIEESKKKLIEAKGDNEVLEAQMAGQKKLAETSADVAAERMRMELELERKAQMARIEAEEMRAKGYTQKDVLNAEVLKSFGENSGASGMSDLMAFSMTSAAMGSAAGMATSMIGNSFQTGQAVVNNMMQSNEPEGWNCSCGKIGISTKFCPECGQQKPEPKQSDTWDCACGAKGLTGKFCPECGAKRPEPVVADTWDCVCGVKGLTGKFCPECGAKRPEPKPLTWTCSCGNSDITGNFCPECGAKRPE